MKAIKYPECNVTFARDQHEYNPLPGWTDGRIAVFCYEFSLWERIKLLFGARLWVEQMTFGMPPQPQRLGLEKPLRSLTPEELAAAEAAQEEAERAGEQERVNQTEDEEPSGPRLADGLAGVDDAVPADQPEEDEDDEYTINGDFVETEPKPRA